MRELRFLGFLKWCVPLQTFSKQFKLFCVNFRTSPKVTFALPWFRPQCPWGLHHILVTEDTSITFVFQGRDGEQTFCQWSPLGPEVLHSSDHRISCRKQEIKGEKKKEKGDNWTSFPTIFAINMGKKLFVAIWQYLLTMFTPYPLLW